MSPVIYTLNVPMLCSKSPKVHAVDLYCGIGGLTYGFSLAGISVRAGIDIDSSCRYAYETNNSGSRFIVEDVREINYSDISPFFEGAEFTLLAGCAPCQPFSAHNRKTSANGQSDYSLVEEFSRLIQEGVPDMVSMENVPDLVNHQSFSDFVLKLEKLDYKIEHGVLSCSRYGVPQTRKRLVLLASRIGEIPLPKPTGEASTVASAIRGLPAIADGASDSQDPAHVTLPLSDRNLRRIRQSKPGGTWKDWDIGDVSACHRKAYYPASYGRMRWDSLAPTITTQFCYYSTGRFGHPEQHRAISVREGALLQTFPKHYRFCESYESLSVRNTARHIGNAVPVKLAQAIGEAVLEGCHV